MGETRLFTSFEQDFAESPDQDFRLPENYKWIKTDPGSQICSAVIYALALVFAVFYCPLFLGVRYKNRKALKSTLKTGAVIYSNHTQPVGDVFIPALAAFPNRIYTIVSPSNYALPVIGKILRPLGALPTAQKISRTKEFLGAVEKRLEQKKCVVIFPEAHVWEYYTGIRPFKSGSFSFPVKCGKPVFCHTVTYKKSRYRKRPRAIVYIDGPFYPDKSLPQKEQAQKLCDTVFKTMQARSKNSDFEYFCYQQVK